MNWIHVYAHDWIKLQTDTQSLERRQMKPIAWEVSKTSVISNKKEANIPMNNSVKMWFQQDQASTDFT
jgi:hypothetical protein